MIEIKRPVILAIMQNQWFPEHHIERIEEMYLEKPDKRNWYIRYFLFQGCLTGKRLLSTLGDGYCWNHIIWEEAHPKIGNKPSANFGYDIDHIQAAIDKHKPDLIICFGATARKGVDNALVQKVFLNQDGMGVDVYFAPHPANRDNPVKGLKELKIWLDKYVEQKGLIVCEN